MPKARAGDLFAVPLPGAGYLTGRVLLDITVAERRSDIQPGSPMWSMRGTFLVEVYGELTPEPSDRMTEPIIRGAWVDPDAILGRTKPKWPLVGHEPIDPREVDFPEQVVDIDSRATFEKGEIRLPVPLPHGGAEALGCNEIFLHAARFPYVCAYAIGRKDLLDEPEVYSPRTSDLRFHPRRDEIYALIDKPRVSYFDWATSLGLDPGRFWR